MVYETGFRKPLSLLCLCDRRDLCAKLKCHFTIVKVKAELDQFAEGLKCCGVLEYMKKFPDIMRPLLVADPATVVTAGKLLFNTLACLQA